MQSTLLDTGHVVLPQWNVHWPVSEGIWGGISSSIEGQPNKPSTQTKNEILVSLILYINLILKMTSHFIQNPFFPI